MRRDRLFLAIPLSALIFFSNPVFAVDLKDTNGPLLDTNKVQLSPDATLDYYVNDRDYRSDSAIRTQSYDYHYEYPRWNLDGKLSYGIKGNAAITLDYTQTLPYVYGYNAYTYDSDQLPQNYDYLSQRYSYKYSGTLSASITKRSPDNGVEWYLYGAYYNQFFAGTLDTRGTTAPYTIVTKTRTDRYTITNSIRMITDPSPKSASIYSDLDGRYFPLVDKGQAEIFFSNEWIFEWSTLKHDQNYLTAPASSFVYPRKSRYKPALISFDQTTTYGLTDDIQLSSLLSYSLPYSLNYEYDYSYPYAPDRHNLLLLEYTYELVLSATPQLRVRTSETTEALVTGYVFPRSLVTRYDYTVMSRNTQTSYTSYRDDSMQWTTYLEFLFRYMSKAKNDPGEPYNGSNLDSLMRPLLCKGQVLATERFRIAPYVQYFKRFYYQMPATLYDYRYHFSYVAYTLECELGYGLTNHLELSGTGGVRLPFDYNFSYNQAGDFYEDRYHYHARPYVSAKLTYRPKQDIQIFVRGSYDAGGTGTAYDITQTVNHQQTTSTNYLYEDYRLDIAAEILF